MMAGLQNGEVHIHDGNWQQFAPPPDQLVIVDGKPMARGLIPRNFKTHPQGYLPKAPPFDLPLIPRSEWAERIAEMEATKSRLSDIRMKAGPNGGMIPSRDQNGRGYCWQHSGVSALLLLRAFANLPYADLSAYAPACLEKKYRDEGGWGAEGLRMLQTLGVPTSEFWPQRAVSSKYDTPEMRANAALHKPVEDWADMNAAEYDRNLTFDQNMTLLLSRLPSIVDFNWWSHSVCGADPVNLKTATLRDPDSGKKAGPKLLSLMLDSSDGYGIRIWNSWGDSWSEQGMGVLSGSKCIPDGSVGARTPLASAA